MKTTLDLRPLLLFGLALFCVVGAVVAVSCSGLPRHADGSVDYAALGDKIKGAGDAVGGATEVAPAPISTAGKLFAGLCTLAASVLTYFGGRITAKRLGKEVIAAVEDAKKDGVVDFIKNPPSMSRAAKRFVDSVQDGIKGGKS